MFHRKTTTVQETTSKEDKPTTFQRFLNSHLVQWIKRRLQIFCGHTCTHLCHYFVEKSYSKYEKLFFFILITISASTAATLLWYSLYLSSETPTVTIVESTHSPTYKIPFPGVTICNVNKISKKAVTALAKELKNPNPNGTFEDNLNTLKLLSGYIDLNTHYGSNFEDLDRLFSHNKLKIDVVVTRVMPLCTEMIQKCYWLGTEVRCDAFFEQIVTYNGACCSFNYIGLKKHVNAASRRATSTILQQVKLVSTSGPFSGLTVVLNPLTDDYFYEANSIAGFRVLIHDSYDYPEINSPNLFIQENYVSYIGIMPESTYSKEEIYNKEIMLRQCYSNKEITLNVMRQYSFINCMVECRRLIAYTACKCIPYNYPRNGSLPVCNAVQQRCIMRIKSKLDDVDPIVNVTIDLMPNLPTPSSCNCLPSCKYYQYTAEMAQGEIRVDQSVRTQFYLRGFKPANQSILHVYYTDIVTTVYRRDMFLNWMSVIAMFGMILLCCWNVNMNFLSFKGGFTGLFLGLTLISTYEISYVFTIRNFFDFLARRSRKVFVQRMEKLKSEELRRKSRVSFQVERY